MVTKQPRWAPDPETYAAHKSTTDDTYREVADRDAQLRDTGIWWTEVDTARMLPSDTESAWRRFRASLPELVWNAARLEGNSFTLPEVRTLLAGVTVGDRSAWEERQVLALSEAYGALRDLVGYGRFHIDKSTSDRLNRIVARHETPDAGRFRGEGTLRRNSSEQLRARFATLQERVAETDDPRFQALIYFCSAARTRFYAGANKRTALLMTTGILLSNGFDPITVPHSRRLELEHALDTLDTTDEATELMAFLVDCAASEG
jgi:prophage maintenance system killer protein